MTGIDLYAFSVFIQTYIWTSCFSFLFPYSLYAEERIYSQCRKTNVFYRKNVLQLTWNVQPRIEEIWYEVVSAQVKFCLVYEMKTNSLFSRFCWPQNHLSWRSWFTVVEEEHSSSENSRERVENSTDGRLRVEYKCSKNKPLHYNCF